MKLARRRQILYDLTDTQNLKKLNLQKKKVKWWLAGAGVGWWERWRDARQRVQAFSYKMNKLWASLVAQWLRIGLPMGLNPGPGIDHMPWIN